MAGLDLQYLADLVVQAQTGDSNAFAELFAATHQKQYAFALRCLKDDFLAQQALQSAYVQALIQITRLGDPMLFVVWLNQLTLRACFSLQATGAGGSPEGQMLALEGGTYSVRQILTLPLSEAQTLLLAHLCGMRRGAVASLLEMSRGEVRRYAQAGCRRLAALGAGKGGDGA